MQRCGVMRIRSLRRGDSTPHSTWCNNNLNIDGQHVRAPTMAHAKQTTHPPILLAPRNGAADPYANVRSGNTRCVIHHAPNTIRGRTHPASHAGAASAGRRLMFIDRFASLGQRIPSAPPPSSAGRAASTAIECQHNTRRIVASLALRTFYKVPSAMSSTAMDNEAR